MSVQNSDGGHTTDDNGIKEIVPPSQITDKKGKGKNQLVQNWLVATVPAKQGANLKKAEYTPPRLVPTLNDNGPSSHLPSSSTGQIQNRESPTIGPTVDPSKRLSFSFTPPLIVPGLRVPQDGPIKQFAPGQKVTYTNDPDRNSRVECGVIFKEVPKDLSYMVIRMEPRHLYRFTRPTQAQIDNAVPIPHYLIEGIPEDTLIDELVHMLSTLNRRKVNSSRIAAKHNGRVSPLQRSPSLL